MPISKAKLKAVMSQHGIPTATQQAVIDGVLDATSSNKSAEHAGYGMLLADLAKVRDTMRTNMSNRKPELRPMYEEYVAILDKVRERIHIARMHGTLEEATKAAALVNEERAAAGRPPGPTNNKTWQSWVPPHIKVAFTNKVVQTYAGIGIIKGNRFTPFMPVSVQRVVKKNENILRKALDRLNATHTHVDGKRVAYTPYRALYLCAARMAELELNRRIKSYELGSTSPVDNPLPVNWLALLDGAMRARLRAAQANPAAVDTEGLQHFLIAAPGDTLQDFQAHDADHAAKHPVAGEDDAMAA